MAKIALDPGHGPPWVVRTCLHCGKVFEVRRCYAKRGQGKFCSTSCGTSYRNAHNNPAKDPAVRQKISQNHADVSGINNPMYGRRGSEAPSWKDGRNAIPGDIWRRVALVNKPHVCEICGAEEKGRRLQVHHIDKNHDNNDLDNLQVVCVRCHNVMLHQHKRGKDGRFEREAGVI
jgi:hypothetical protein